MKSVSEKLTAMDSRVMRATVGKLHIWEGHPNPTWAAGNEAPWSVGCTEQRWRKGLWAKGADGMLVLVWAVENLGSLGRGDVEWAGRARQEPVNFIRRAIGKH